MASLPCVRMKKHSVYCLKTTIVSASGWCDDFAIGVWIDQAVNLTMGWDDLIDSGHPWLVALDFKIAEPLMQFPSQATNQILHRE